MNKVLWSEHALLFAVNMPEMVKSVADIKTAPFDPRFPNTNQTR